MLIVFLLYKMSTIMFHVFSYVVYTDEFTLNSLPQERGFMVRDAPRDGDCPFSAVAVQLNNLGIHPGGTSLREQLVEYLEAHDCSSHFRSYVLPL